jgi:ornithine decarboxylase
MFHLPDQEFNKSILENLKHATPFFLFSVKKIESKFMEFKKLFPKAAIHYAMKANSEPQLLKILNNKGCCFEVASKYELDLLKKIHVKPDRIIYGTSVKPIEHIKYFYKYGVTKYSADSQQELEKIAIAAPKSKVYIRTVVNDAGSVFKFSEKFGTDVGNVMPLLHSAKSLGLVPYGISFHVGSQASNPLAWASAIASLNYVIEELIKNGIKIEILNIGGGYPCQYVSSDKVPSLEEIAHNTLEQYQKLHHQPHIVLEPGRGIVAESGVAVVKVIGKVERAGGSTWLFLDAGVYNAFFEAMSYQGSTRYPISSTRPVSANGEKLFSLAGPTGDSPDIITKEALLPADTEVGDILVVHNVGAYTLPAVSKFNGFPKPKVYFI